MFSIFADDMKTEFTGLYENWLPSMIVVVVVVVAAETNGESLYRKRKKPLQGKNKHRSIVRHIKGHLT